MNLKNKITAGVAGLVGLTTGVQVMRPATMDTSTSANDVHAFLVKPTPVAAVTLSIKKYATMNATVGATADENEMLVKANDYVNQVEGSYCYKNLVAQASFTETNLEASTSPMTNQQIYDYKIMNPVFYGVNIYSGSWWSRHVSKTMGYDIGDGVVYLDRYYVNTPELMGSLILHETDHGLGWHHYQVKSTSIPYTDNGLFDKCLGKP